MAEPDTLFKLALDTFVNYVCNLFAKLIEPVEAQHDWARSVQLINDQLQNLFNAAGLSKPNYLTDFVKNRILTVIDELLFEAERKKHINQEILFTLLNCIIHPGAKKIKPVSDLLPCSNTLGSAHFKSFLMNYMLATKLNCQNKLMVLQYKSSYKETDRLMNYIEKTHGRQLPLETKLFIYQLSIWGNFKMNSIIMSQLYNLEDYCGYCNDELISTMLKNCKHLRCLNIVTGAHVTDLSVCKILKFEHLEYLNIKNTGISPNGISMLLNGLRKKERSSSLKCLHLYQVSLQDLKILQNIPDLKIVIFSIREISEDNSIFTELEKVKNFHGIHVWSYSGQIFRMLRVIGNQLAYLDLSVNTLPPIQQHSIIQVIGECCISLKCLHISSHFRTWEATPDCFILPGFQSVTCLKYNEKGLEKIEKSAKSGLLHFLLRECINLKKISFISFNNITSKSDLVNSIFKFNLMKNLEEVYWHSRSVRKESLNYEDDVKASLLLLKNCLNLRVVGGLSAASTQHNNQRVKFINYHQGEF